MYLTSVCPNTVYRDELIIITEINVVHMFLSIQLNVDEKNMYTTIQKTRGDKLKNEYSGI